MALFHGEAAIIIPPSLLSIPNKSKRRSTNFQREETFDLSAIVAQCAGEGTNVEVSVAGLQEPSNGPSPGHLTRRPQMGRRFSFHPHFRERGDSHAEFLGLSTPSGFIRQRSASDHSLSVLAENIPERAFKRRSYILTSRHPLGSSFENYEFPSEAEETDYFSSRHHTSRDHSPTGDLSPVQYAPHSPLTEISPFLFPEGAPGTDISHVEAAHHKPNRHSRGFEAAHNKSNRHSKRFEAVQNKPNRNSKGFETLAFEDDNHVRMPRHSMGFQNRRPSMASKFRKFSTVSINYLRGRRRNNTLHDLYEKAKEIETSIHRSVIYQKTLEYIGYTLLLAALYLLLIGVPLWKGVVQWMYIFLAETFVLQGGCAIFTGTAFFYAFGPLLIFFEKDPVEDPVDLQSESSASARSRVECCALIIPCYKSESLIGATLEAALKVFPAKNIFVVANGNSLEPLDNTAAVCDRYNVSHTWCPIGSKIIAQFLGSYISKDFPFTLLIDDDCHLPPDFPVVTDRMTGNIKCIGYTIKSVGPGGLPGTLCHQAQDIEYKLSGLQRAFAGKLGSATFPHGAIALWDRELLIQTFHAHPGFSISEDWFFGHVARELGSRILMCTQIFVETETPPSIFWVDKGEARGGFGEMTVYKQRFYRWNFFFVNDIYWNMRYILCSWKLGFWEIGTKIFVWQEVYETIIFLLTPFVLPISLVIRPQFCAILFAATFVMYFINVVLFNEIHLRRKKERASWLAVLYYMPYKIILFAVNVASCYYSIYKYMKYFAKRHPKVVQDPKVVKVILDFMEIPSRGNSSAHSATPSRRQSVRDGSKRRSLMRMPLYEV